MLAKFWHLVLDPDENLWLFEEQDATELQHHSSDAVYLLRPADTKFPYHLADKLLDRCNTNHGMKQVGRLAHLDVPTRLRCITWLFVVVCHCINDSPCFNVSNAIQSWERCSSLPSQVLHTTNACRSGCSPAILDLWLQTVMHVYPPTYLALMPWGCPCSCLKTRLAKCSPPPSRTMGFPGVLHSLLFQMFAPAWPSILWVLFCQMKPNTSKLERIETFLSLLHNRHTKDILIWDITDQDLLFWSRHQFKIGVFREYWYQCAKEIDCSTWAKIMMITSVTDCPSVHHDPLLRICAWYLACSASLTMPSIVLETFKLELSSTPWTDILQIAHRPAPVTLCMTDLDNTPHKEFWNPTGLDQRLDKWFDRQMHDKCNRIWHIPVGLSVLEQLNWMSYIYDSHEVSITLTPDLLSTESQRQGIQPLYAFYPAMRVLKHNSVFKLLSEYRSDFQTLLNDMRFTPLKNLIHSKALNSLATTHSFASDLNLHVTNSLFFMVVQLVSSLRDHVIYKDFLLCRGPEAQEILDFLQDLLDLELLSEIRPLLFKLMLRLSRTSGLYPRCFSLTGLQKIGKQVAGGGYGDIWRGLLRGQRVCIKMMRIFQKDDIQLEFGSEALIWRQLCHPNLLPFFGLYFIEERLCLISPWMDDGNIMEYLRANSVDQEHRISMIMDVALGLEYLHKQATVHGDLKGINILVTPSGRACIADFGLAIIINAMTLRLSSSTTISRAGTVRYQAPELVEPELNGRKTFHTDIYAFACVCYEILTGKIPFYECPSEIKVMLDVMAGKRPSRAPSCSGSARLDCLWELMQRCWDGDPTKRPSATEIVRQLIEPKIGATTTSSTTDWDHEFTAQFRRSLNMEPLLPSVNQLERTIFGAGKTRVFLLVQTSLTH
ncbi:kinase domain-containing protein [Favolaschia claudopus]|uniref:Kinase domain-containing protein n=1 Tax=Favolaschia claudopus TaxID=2862362 RepID=A0AAW0BIS5_9AGAR